jgi:hypothetical protein
MAGGVPSREKYIVLTQKGLKAGVLWHLGNSY